MPQTPRRPHPSPLAWPALACGAALLLAGCSAAKQVHASSAKIPGLQEDAPLYNRGGTNPNAPYTTVDRSVHLVTRPTQIDVNAAPYCAATDLNLFESGAHVDGDQRSVRLNLVNHGKQPCRLGGYPAISLLHKDGSLIGNVAIEKVTGTMLEAALHAKPGGAPPTTEGAPQASAPSPYVLLAPSGEATFEVGWMSGEHCDQVGSIAVAAPGTTQSFLVRHSINVCEGRIRVTALSDGTQL